MCIKHFGALRKNVNASPRNYIIMRCMARMFKTFVNTLRWKKEREILSLPLDTYLDIVLISNNCILE